jgi:hypothetical protein
MKAARDPELVTLRDAARQLADAAGRVAPPLDAAAWQDGLDLLAVSADLKPVCLLGRGDVDARWLATARGIAGGLGLAVQDGLGWLPEGPANALPPWYRDATAARLRAAPVAYAYRDPRLGARIAALAAATRVSAADEAGLLGYPPCCVAQHHTQTLALEQLTIALLARIAGEDTAHLQRLVAAGVQPTPRAADEWQRFHAVTAIDPEPFTSINRCAACAVDLDAPAGQMGRAYRALAEQLDYLPPPHPSPSAAMR